MSSMFKKEVMECKRELFICEMHYAEDDIEYNIQNKEWHQALPTMNLPLKSHEDTKVDRKLPAFRIVTTERDDVERKEVFVYKDLDELHKRVQKCNWITEKWYTTYENNAVKLTSNIEPHIVPYLEVVIDEKLQFTIIVLGGCYQIVMHYMKTILDRYKQWLSNLLRVIMNHELCVLGYHLSLRICEVIK